MNITVVLCTYNRCETLTKTLDSVAASALPSSVEWEVLVIDNNSSDRTRKVVEDSCRRHPGRFRYVLELRQGKSHALNAALREARGDILAFMDDDVTVEPAWLQNLTEALQSQVWAGSGGRILPQQAFTPPRWLSLGEPYDLGAPLCGLFDLGDNPCQLDRPPYGANMAFRKTMFEKYGGFRTDLGPPPSNKIRGEDTEFGRRLMVAGERLRYEPSAIVHHPVLDDRLNKKYFLAWWFDDGQGAIRLRGKRPPVWGVPRHYFSILHLVLHLLPASTLRWILAVNSGKRFFCKCQVWKTAGQIVEISRWFVQPKETSEKFSSGTMGQ